MEEKDDIPTASINPATTILATMLLKNVAPTAYSRNSLRLTRPFDGDGESCSACNLPGTQRTGRSFTCVRSAPRQWKLAQTRPPFEPQLIETGVLNVRNAAEDCSRSSHPMPLSKLQPKRGKPKAAPHRVPRPRMPFRLANRSRTDDLSHPSRPLVGFKKRREWRAASKRFLT